MSQRVSRRDFARMMAVGGASLFSTSLISKLFAAENLAGEARRAGFGDPQLEKGSLSTWGRLKFRCVNGDATDWSVHPYGDINLIQQMNDVTTTSISETWHVADIGSLDEMAKFPLLYMHAENTTELTPQEVRNLREYLLRGGFLYAEDCVMGKCHHHQAPGNWDFFFRSMLKTLRQIIPEATCERLPLDHPIFSTYFDLPRGQPHMQGIAHGAFGLIHNKRLLAYLSPSDAHCGWASETFFGPEKTKECLKIGTNVYLYAMTH